MGPKEVPNIGCWAVVADPQGATFGIYEPAHAPPLASAPRDGEFSWHELTTSDYKAAGEFYHALFHWDTSATSTWARGHLPHVRPARRDVRRNVQSPPGHAAAELAVVRSRRRREVRRPTRCKSAGGTVLNGPMEVPGGDWIAQCLDPQGAAFALHTK